MLIELKRAPWTVWCLCANTAVRVCVRVWWWARIFCARIEAKTRRRQIEDKQNTNVSPTHENEYKMKNDFKWLCRALGTRCYTMCDVRALSYTHTEDVHHCLYPSYHVRMSISVRVSVLGRLDFWQYAKVDLELKCAGDWREDSAVILPFLMTDACRNFYATLLNEQNTKWNGFQDQFGIHFVAGNVVLSSQTHTPQFTTHTAYRRPQQIARVHPFRYVRKTNTKSKKSLSLMRKKYVGSQRSWCVDSVHCLFHSYATHIYEVRA